MMALQQVAIMTRARLIVGLGNPGPKYIGTRHNVGRELVQRLAMKVNVSFTKISQFEGYVAETVINERKVFLLLPETGMNGSGRSIQKLCQYYAITPQETVVVADEMAFTVGKSQLNLRGGHGGHNGLRSVQEYLQSKEYVRLRVGIDTAEDCRRHVLSSFSEEEKKQLPEDDIIDALQALCIDGFPKVATSFNTQNKRMLRNFYEGTRTASTL